MSTWCTGNQLRSRHNHQLSITYYRCTSEPWAMSCIETSNSLHLKQSSRSCAHQPDMRAGCIDCHLLSEHNRWLSIKNLMQFNARGDAFHQPASPDLAYWWCWLRICFGSEYAVMLSSTGHVLIWSHSISNCAHGEHMQQMWISTTLSLNLSMQWNFPFLQDCRRLYSAAIAIGGIQRAQLQ